MNKEKNVKKAFLWNMIGSTCYSDTTQKERAVKMGQLRKVSKTEKIVFILFKNIFF